MAEDKAKGVRQIANELKGLDTSGVEVDDEQTPPTFDADSAEETALLQQMEAKLDGEAASASREHKLMCLRGRKYDVDRAAELLPNFLALMQEFGPGTGDSAQLKDDLKSRKFVNTGGRDIAGRAMILLRFRHHDPKKSKANDMARLVVLVMLEVLTGNPDAQRVGIAILNDVSGVGLKNVDPAVPKLMFSKVFPRLPIRIGRICIFNPPWFFGHVLLPIVMFFMSPKLKV